MLNTDPPADFSLTFVIPFKDSATTLERCIKSLLNQSDSDFNCVFIDDGSTDNWSDVVYDLIDRRFRVISNPCNLGVSESRNIGNRLATGSFIAVLDADDEAKKDRVAETKRYCRGNPSVDLLITLEEPYHQLFPWLLVVGNYVTHSNVTVSRDFILRNHLFYDPKYKVAHDYDLYCRSALKRGNFVLSTSKFCERYESPKGLMQSCKAEMIAETLTIKSYYIAQLLPFLTRNHCDAMSRFLTFTSFAVDGDVETVFNALKSLEENQEIPPKLLYLFSTRYKDMLSGAKV